MSKEHNSIIDVMKDIGATEAVEHLETHAGCIEEQVDLCVQLSKANEIITELAEECSRLHALHALLEHLKVKCPQDFIDEAKEQVEFMNERKGLKEKLNEGWTRVPDEMPAPDNRFDFMELAGALIHKPKEDCNGQR